MKVLCLHGRGTSGAIFRSQTSSICARLTDLPLEFDFLDGPYPCPPAPGIDLFYKPPYYSYFPDASYTVEDLHRTRAWLSEIIAARGPYDLVLTFSQGAALAAAMLLLHEVDLKTQEQNQERNQEQIPPPFKSAIFICGGAPLSLLEHIGYRISPTALARDAASRTALTSMADSAAILSKGSSRWTGLEFDEQSFVTGGFREDDVRREIEGDVKIRVPTVHIYGSRDPRYVAGIQLSEVCEQRCRKVYNHGGGHEIPRFEAVSGTIADLVRWALLQ